MVDNGGGALVRAVGGLPANCVPRAKMLGGLENFTPGQLGLRPLELRIIHAIRSANDIGRPGQLRLGQRLFDALEVVFLKADPYRVLQEGEGDNTHNVCASSDGWTPLEELRTPKSPRCMEAAGDRQRPLCPYAEWDTNPATQKRVPPPCNEGIVFMGLTAQPNEEPLPFWFPTSRTARMASREFLQELSNIPHAENLFQFRIRLATTENRSRGGGFNWFTPVFTVSETLSDESYESYRALADRVRPIRYTPFVRDDGADDEAQGGPTVETSARPAGSPAAEPVPASDLGVPFVFPGDPTQPFFRV